jgi:hypothetical protein
VEIALYGNTLPGAITGREALVNIEEFRASILDRRLALLFDYWHRLRFDRLMPDWADIKPEDIAPVLPFAWAWRRDEEGEFRLRLAGEAVVEVMELNLRGKTPFDLYPAAAAERVFARICRVAEEPTCSFSIGPILQDQKPIGLGQRLVLPYHDRKTGRTGAFGASTLEKQGRAGNGGSTLYELTGDEYFLALI